MTLVLSLLLISSLVLASGCGSYGDNGAYETTQATTVSAAEAETALKAELGEGGGGGIVQHESDIPTRVTCTKNADAPRAWRCTVEPSKTGESYLCMVEVDPQTKRATETTCARVDN